MREKIFTNCFLVKNGTDGKPDEVCLAMKKRGFGEGLWNGSGGKPNENETVEEAAVREIQEELGVRVTKMEKRAEIDFVLKEEEKIVKMHTFVATEWEGEPTESEEMKPQWFKVESVPYDQMWKGDREWLPLISEGKKIKAKYTYTREGGEVVERRIEEIKKTVLITGASRGIGMATAKLFLQNNYQVIGTSTTGNFSINEKSFTGYKLDLSSERSIKTFTKEINKGEKSIDILVNNAAIMIDQSDTIVDINKLNKTLDVNLIGTISLTEKLLPYVNDNGVIVNMSSELGSLIQNMPNKAYSYRISKTALNMYTRTLSQRLRNRNISVYSFAPGWVKTDMGTIHAPRLPDEPAKEIFELCESKKESGLFYEKNNVRNW